MPSVQFPLWVTYSLACIAILGPIGGALFGAGLTARRDDRRWDREKKSDDLRWEREQEGQRELKIFEERKTAYGQALVATAGWFGQLNSRYNRLIGALGPADRPAEIERCADDALAALALVRLVGNPSVAAPLSELLNRLEEFQDDLQSWEEWEQEEEGTGVTSHANARRSGADCREMLASLRQAARSDIEALLINPSRPSVPTS